MTSPNSVPKYDRDFLLGPDKRNQLVELWEVEKYGRDSFGDPDHVHLYGMAPRQWWERGVRILARTCLEAAKDPLGDAEGPAVAKGIAPASGKDKVWLLHPVPGLWKAPCCIHDQCP